jgi:hypothetical protein
LPTPIGLTATKGHGGEGKGYSPKIGQDYTHFGTTLIDGHGINRRMNKTNVTLALLALLQGILHADLFDTVAQLDAKYGEPTLVEPAKYHQEKRIYKSGLYIIEAHVTADDSADELGPNKCVKERHTRIDGKFLGGAEIKTILTRRHQRGEWQYKGNDTWKLTAFGNYLRHIDEINEMVESRKITRATAVIMIETWKHAIGHARHYPMSKAIVQYREH